MENQITQKQIKLGRKKIKKEKIQKFVNPSVIKSCLLSSFIDPARKSIKEEEEGEKMTVMMMRRGKRKAKK